MYKLVGYQEKKGNFTNKETGEVVEYHKYDLFYITDEKPEIKGFFADSASANAKDLRIRGAKTLDECLNKEVYLIADLTARTDENGKARLNVSNIVVC